MWPKIKLSSRFEPPPHLPLSASLAESATKICELYIKRLLSAALNSSLNGFSSGEEIFSKKPRRREGHYCFNPLTSSHFKTFLEGEMASCLPNPNLNPSGPGRLLEAAVQPASLHHLHSHRSCIHTEANQMNHSINAQITVQQSAQKRRSVLDICISFNKHLCGDSLSCSKS